MKNKIIAAMATVLFVSLFLFGCGSKADVLPENQSEIRGSEEKEGGTEITKSEGKEEKAKTAEVSESTEAERDPQSTGTSGGKDDAASICAEKQHTWQPQYDTIEHPSKGEMRKKQVGKIDDAYICNTCKAEFHSESAFTEHVKADVGVHNDCTGAAYTVRTGSPIYDYEWVVTQEAWTENVIVGYTCTTCGLPQ